jgi:hypothetical protein
LLQSPGTKNLVITAAGYSDDSVVQNLTVPSFSLGGVSLSGGKVTFGFTNATGLSFSVLGTNDLTAPITTWPVVGAVVETPSGSGHYEFIDSNPATNGTWFYRLRQP